MKVYFVPRTVNCKPSRATQGVVEWEHWVTLKKAHAADGFVITYWNPVSDSAWKDAAARRQVHPIPDYSNNACVA